MTITVNLRVNPISLLKGFLKQLLPPFTSRPTKDGGITRRWTAFHITRPLDRVLVVAFGESEREGAVVKPSSGETTSRPGRARIAAAPPP